MFYKNLIRPLLFSLPPEFIHDVSVSFLKNKILQSFLQQISRFESLALEKEILGLKFKNPVGLAAGFDKNAEAIDGFAAMGFGFIEIGTVTPKSQPGNPKPRLFRLPSDKALINRMGFNNLGAERAIENIKKNKKSVVIGANIGKNKLTPNENAIDDYIYCLEQLFEYADYFVVNVSSPNTPGLRQLQEKKPLIKLLSQLKELLEKRKSKPLFLKIAPDLTNSQLEEIVDVVKQTKTDGIVATNTTTGREHLSASKEDIEKIGQGGLSGKPLFDRSTEVLRKIRQLAGDGLILIGAGGIMSPQLAVEKVKAGADLIQIYSGLIYEGPQFVKHILKEIIKKSG